MGLLSITGVKFIDQPNFQTVKLGETCSQYDAAYELAGEVFQAINNDDSKRDAAWFLLLGGAAGEFVPAISFDSGVQMELTGPTLEATKRYILAATAGRIAEVEDLASGQKLVELAIGTAANRWRLDKTNTGIAKA